MKIHVFTVTEESYHHGDLNNSTKKFFKREDLRDDYYEYLIRFYWSYYIGKGEEDLEIIEEKNW